MLGEALACSFAFVVLFYANVAAVCYLYGFSSLAVFWCFILAFSGFCGATYAYAKTLKPNAERLAVDLRRLQHIVPLKAYEESDYNVKHVQTYYSSTTFRDYKLLELATGCNAMHTQLKPTRKLPFHPGQLQQLLYVIAHMGDNGRKGNILEVGFGKGSNSIFLASTFPHAKFTGVDIVQDHVAYATRYATKAGVNNATFQLGNASNPPEQIKSSSYDLIYGIESFCHIDTDADVTSFLQFAQLALKPGGKIVIVDGFRSRNFDSLSSNVQQAMNLAESGFRIRRMTSKPTWEKLAEFAGFGVIEDTDLTQQAVGFWRKGWRVAQLVLCAPAVLKWYFSSSLCRGETGANFVSVLMTAYAMSLGSAEYGVLVLQKRT